MTTQHTLTPWQQAAFSSRLITDSAGMSDIAQCERQSDAAFIVRACNAHDELVAALRQLAKEVSLLTNEGDDQLVGCAYIDKHNVIRAKGSLLYTIERARAALAKAAA
jgi:hypothetical protein